MIESLTVVDSWLRCPNDGKKLVIEAYTESDREEYNLHVCWNCGYRTTT